MREGVLIVIHQKPIVSVNDRKCKNCPGIGIAALGFLTFECLPSNVKLAELLVNEIIHGFGLKGSITPLRSGFLAGKYLETFVNRLHDVDMELPILYGIDNVFAKHQIPDIVEGNHHPLGSGETAGHADVIEALDFQIDPADRLDFTFLIDRTRNGDILP